MDGRIVKFKHTNKIQIIMKRFLFLNLFALACINAGAQNSFPTSGSVNIDSNLILRNKLIIGADAENGVTIKYVPGTTTFPSMFKISAPGGSKPIDGNSGGGDKS